MGGGTGDGGVQVQGREGSRSKGGRKEKGERMGRRSEKRENQTRASEKECEEKNCPLLSTVKLLGWCCSIHLWKHVPNARAAVEVQEPLM